MYATCLFCNKPLGANEVLEMFPVGRRIAFDSSVGRLWVVCGSCERWNLSPLEERLEIIEECERLFSETRMRVSTENIGLAKLHEGLELVRIGRPLRPEFAAWRYGDQFGRRRRRLFVRGGVALGAVALVVSGAAAAGVAFGGFFQFGGQLYRPLVYGSDNKIIARLPVGDGRVIVRRKHARKVNLLSDGANGWQLEVPHGVASWQLDVRDRKEKVVLLSGDEAQNAAKLLLPHINPAGGNTKQVSTAVNLLEVARDPMDYLASVARKPPMSALTRGGKAPIAKMPAEVRLALEMATHEEAERRALEGELKALEIAWQEAEEIGAIADSLTLPAWITDWMKRH